MKNSDKLSSNANQDSITPEFDATSWESLKNYETNETKSVLPKL